MKLLRSRTMPGHLPQQMSLLRQLPRACAQGNRTLGLRSLSTSRAVFADAETPAVAVTPPPPPKRPVGGFRGGLFGFLLGFSLASGLASYHLLDEYKLASATLQASVAELQESTEKVSAHVRRIEAVEKDLRALTERSSTREEVSKVRGEMKKLFDGLHIEFLDLKAHVWGFQQELHKVTSKNGTAAPTSNSN